MLFEEIMRAFFADATRSRDRTFATSRDTAVFSKFTEPSAEIRAAARQHRPGVPRPQTGNSELIWTGPGGYEAIAVHRRASTRAGLASSDALIVTRFHLTGADGEMFRLLGRETEGCSVLDLDLCGLELAWHNDLMRSLDSRAAIWSISRLVQSSGDILLEHIVLPTWSGNRQMSFVGWYHRVGGNLDGDLIWSDVLSVERERHGQRVSACLTETALPKADFAESDRYLPRDVVSECRERGAI